MKRNFSVVITCASFLFMNTLYAAEKNDDLQQLANDTYIYVYPLVTMDMTKDVMTNVDKFNGIRGPINQFANSTDVSNAWVDLSKEPYVLHVPDENGRYYILRILDAWTNVIASIGTKTTGTNAQNFVLIGPNWKGINPKGLKIIKSPTNLVWITGKTSSSGTAEDDKQMRELQSQYNLTPLSFYGKPYTPPQINVDPDIDMQKPVRDQVNNLDANQYYRLASMLMKQNPPLIEDEPIVKKLNRLGIKPGEDFDVNKVTPEIADALKNAIVQAQQKILSVKDSAEKTSGTDYLHRAKVAALELDSIGRSN